MTIKILARNITLLTLICNAVLISSCGEGPEQQSGAQFSEIRGKTMGTTYLVKYEDPMKIPEFDQTIDALLKEINQAVSTYIPNSLISTFNKTGELIIPLDENGVEEGALNQHFAVNLHDSKVLSELTQGAFDPTVSPLVNAWGFGWDGKQPEAPGSSTIDSMLQLVGMDLVEVTKTDSALLVRAARPGVMLDFSAIAKGYAVDRIADVLEREEYFNYFVEVGGEVRVKGSGTRGSGWIVGVNTPDPSAGLTELYARVRLTEGGMATSGNYRNFYSVDGRTVWHTINPATGYPEENNLLSATIVSPSCATSDALATACMVAGYPDCLDLISVANGASGFFIYASEQGSLESASSSDFKKYLIGDAAGTDQ